jgi:protein-S-isoprenylcysteine O-methyltransferase Ste14
MTAVAFVFFAFLMVGIVVAAVLLDARLGIRLRMTDHWSMAAGLPVLALGVALVAWCILTFGSAGGTPVPFSPPGEVVARGPYVHTRNPMLTGLFAALAGAALLLRSPMLLFVLLPALIAAATAELKLIEEPELEKRLGAAYADYRRRVPMFLPRPARTRRIAAVKEVTG